MRLALKMQVGPANIILQVVRWSPGFGCGRNATKIAADPRDRSCLPADLETPKGLGLGSGLGLALGLRSGLGSELGQGAGLVWVDAQDLN